MLINDTSNLFALSGVDHVNGVSRGNSAQISHMGIMDAHSTSDSSRVF